MQSRGTLRFLYALLRLLQADCGVGQVLFQIGYITLQSRNFRLLLSLTGLRGGSFRLLLGLAGRGLDLTDLLLQLVDRPISGLNLLHQLVDLLLLSVERLLHLGQLGIDAERSCFARLRIGACPSACLRSRSYVEHQQTCQQSYHYLPHGRFLLTLIYSFGLLSF